MKKTQWIDLIKNIQKTKVSFLSIVLLVALGIGVFNGFGWTGQAIRKSVDNEYELSDIYDIEILFPYGMSSRDIDELEEIDGVDKAEGIYFSFQNFSYKSKNYLAKVSMISEEVNRLSQITGELPAKKGEIAVEASWAKKRGIAIGDKITFVHDDDGQAHYLSDVLNGDLDALTADGTSPDGMKYLTTDTFVVTALVESAVYISSSTATYGSSLTDGAPVKCLMYVAEDSFDEEAFTGYLGIYLRSDKLRQFDFDDDQYKTLSDDLKEAVSPAATKISGNKNELIAEKLDDIVADANARLDAAKKELDEGEQQIADGEKQIADGEKQLKEGRQTLEEKKAEAAAAQVKVDNGWAQVEENRPKIEEARTQINAAKAQLDDAAAQLNAAKAQLDDARTKYDAFHNTYAAYIAGYNQQSDNAGRCQYVMDKYADGTLPGLAEQLKNNGMIEDSSLTEAVDGYMEYLAGVKRELDSKEKTIADVQDKVVSSATEAHGVIDEALSQAQSKIDEGQQQYDEGYAQYASGKAEYDKKLAQLQSAEKQLADGIAKLQAGQAEIDAGWQTIQEKELLIEQKEEELEESKAKLAAAKEEYEQGTADYEENEQQVRKLESQAAEFKEYGCTIATRAQNAGASSAAMIIDVFSRIRYNMASLFVIVGLFVCYSAISRIVNEQIVQLGTKKAIGLYNREIILAYLMYSGLAVVMGSALGLILARFVIEPCMLTVLNKIFLYGEKLAYFSVPEAALVILLELALILASTYLACRSILKRSAIRLLAGAETVKGKVRFYEKFRAWERLPLFTKTIVNNCMNDKRRVFATLVGVAGCTALVTSAVYMNEIVGGSFEKHYETVYDFDRIVRFHADSDTGEEMKEILDEMSVPNAEILYVTGALKLPEGGMMPAYMYVSEDEGFTDRVNVHDRKGNEAVYGDGVWLSQAYAREYNVQPGDTVNYISSSGVVHELTVDGIMEYYLTSIQLIMSPQAYEKEFGQKPDYNAFLVKVNDLDTDKILGKLKTIDGYISADNYYNSSRQGYDIFSTVSTAVVIAYVAMAVAMAALVLLNLLTMFVSEKKKELIVLMINGYTIRDARRYIYSDTIFLTVIGILLGLVLGYFMGNLATSSLETSITSFMSGFAWKACAAGTVTSAALAFLMTVVALRRIGKFHLTDINK